MTTTALLIAALLYSIIGLTAAEYAPSCTCSPQSLTLRINLSGTCPANITNVDGNNQFCFVSQIGGDSGSSVNDTVDNLGADESKLLPPTDPIPTSISSISYYELSESMEVINQETITLQDNNTAEEFAFTSISTNIDPHKSFSEQLQFVVSSAILIIEGTTAAGKLLKNKVSWKYDLHQCDMIPMAIGNTLGWLDLIDLELPRSEICPAVDVVDAAATTTESTANFSNATNDTSYTSTISPVNTTYSSSEVMQSKEPTKLPTLAPLYPTYSPTYQPTYYPTYSPTAETAEELTTDDSEGNPSLSEHSSSGWDADGWTPPETHLLVGSTQTSIGTTTTLATEESTLTNGTESSISAATAEGINTTTIATVTTSNGEVVATNSTVTNTNTATSTTTLATRPPKTTTTSVATRPPKPTTTTTVEATRPPKTTTTSSTAATRPPKPTTTTTTVEATRPPKTTITTAEATRPPKTTTTTAATITTTNTYATRPPKTTVTTATVTTTATRSSKQETEEVLSQNINYLGTENGGRKKTFSSIWLTSLVVLVMGTFPIME